MLKSIIDTLNGTLLATNYFEKLYCLSELVKDATGSVRPMQYIALGEYEQVNDFDYYNGVGYWRKTSDVSVSPYDNPMVSCSNIVQIVYPLKFVCAIPKAKLPIDDQYTDDSIANEVMIALSGNNNAMKGLIKAQSVNVVPLKYTTDNQVILASEYPGIDIKDIDYKFAYLSFDFDVQVIINKNCIQNNC